jgi:hypothetical protein
MKSLLYVTALLLILAWSIGFIGYGLGGAFHSLLALALLSVLMRVVLDKKLTHRYSA